jgi:xanthine/uracil permease
MALKYDLDENPPPKDLILYGLQWLAISIPGIVILGKIVGVIHFSDPSDQILYLQKMYFATALTLFCQVIWGHRLPVIVGPSAVLLIGVMGSGHPDLNTLYTSIILGGAVLCLLAVTGLFGFLQRLFTPRVVATVLLLIAVTLMPAIIQLLSVPGPRASVAGNLCFAAVAVLVMLLLYRHLTGMWRSTLIVWSMAGASFTYPAIFGYSQEMMHAGSTQIISSFFHNLTTRPSLDPAMLVSFLFCFFALSINDLGSIQSVSQLLRSSDPQRRVNRGIAFTGLGNMVSGFLGVIGPVNFSLSPGVIMASRCASRFTLIPTAVFLLLISISPVIVRIIGGVPPVVIGTILLYVLCYQVAGGLIVACGSGQGISLEAGLVIGLPVLFSILVSFLPSGALDGFPGLIRPIAGNGFVIGILTVLILEHLIFVENTAIK